MSEVCVCLPRMQNQQELTETNELIAVFPPKSAIKDTFFVTKNDTEGQISPGLQLWPKSPTVNLNSAEEQVMAPCGGR